ARDVVERVEGQDRVERPVRELELGEVRADELGPRDRGASPLDLPRRDVDAGEGEPLRETPRLGRPGPAAELEHSRAVVQARDELLLPLPARVTDDLLAPRGEGVADRVV